MTLYVFKITFLSHEYISTTIIRQSIDLQCESTGAANYRKEAWCRYVFMFDKSNIRHAYLSSLKRKKKDIWDWKYSKFLLYLYQNDKLIGTNHTIHSTVAARRYWNIHRLVVWKTFLLMWKPRYKLEICLRKQDLQNYLEFN